MLNWFVLNMFFLYFPEDKSEYIPAVLMMAVFVIGAVIVFMLFRRASKREEARVNEKYSELRK
ncbi:hypothetical protein [Bacillus thermotolerans]|uniref:Uncharacterized protein n=1 Tax=Bacillus thermotolerans TaxID=1221996 RepID=A0A0F5I919_BACTR|nr:hypothetical protein [Bacillus thermotolerans]KKB34977.1 hypothetical protein QY97_02034 [Bacillus thermotolerans]KKB40591.1 hypothetical protein QY96_02327 [Bacillus thermotolerans]KKB42011.1 hypothetical protein QY95_00434 [Bacillus thermotolerans]